MVFDPFKNLGVLVSGIVVDDHMRRLLLGHLGINDVEEADELLLAMALHTLADDLAFQHIKRCSGFRHRRAGPMAGGRRRARPGQGHNAFGYLWARWRNARGTSLVAPKPRYAFFAKPFLPAARSPSWPCRWRA